MEQLPQAQENMEFHSITKNQSKTLHRHSGKCLVVWMCSVDYHKDTGKENKWLLHQDVAYGSRDLLETETNKRFEDMCQ